MKTFGNLIIYEVTKTRPFRMMGSLVDALDYFITIFENNEDINLVLLNSNELHKLSLESFIYNRYNLPIEIISKLIDKILVMDYSDLRVSVINKILILDYYTALTMSLYCPVVCKNMYIIVENGSEHHFPEAKYYTELPQIFKVRYNNIPYIMKMRMDIVNKPKKNKGRNH